MVVVTGKLLRLVQRRDTLAHPDLVVHSRIQSVVPFTKIGPFPKFYEIPRTYQACFKSVLLTAQPQRYFR